MKTYPFLATPLRTGLLQICAALTIAAAIPAALAAAPKVYRFTSTATNTAERIMTLDHPSLNGKPTLGLIATQYSTGVSNPHPIGVRYHYSLKKWQIFNEVLENIPVNSGFNVMVAPTTKRISVAPTNVDAAFAFFPTQKGNPAAQLLVTHMANPTASFGAVSQPSNIGLFYIPAGSRAPASSGRWSLYQENTDPHLAVVYNVADVTNLKIAKTAISFRHTATDPNSTGNETVITHALTDGKPDAVLFVQHVFTNTAPKSVDEVLGVRYADGKWRIFAQDGSDMPFPAEFVVTAFPAVTP